MIYGHLPTHSSGFVTTVLGGQVQLYLVNVTKRLEEFCMHSQFRKQTVILIGFGLRDNEFQASVYTAGCFLQDQGLTALTRELRCYTRAHVYISSIQSLLGSRLGSPYDHHK